MIDYFAIALTHGLMALAVWRLLARPDLDDDSLVGEEEVKPKPWLVARDEDAREGSGGGHG
ncbi:hypothetical protein D2V17_13150 [Aurantiacibacter xanthus]|uniref:Uncharacterized protein n=1 Tax=Aurantiacibacter xanthus TaxID=1784712 RepID=A0A3A1P267_9SPHN|nr:hypothetical protein [Aurantiacibacter xanthus]RIV83530.1 hypothetical protein D2V17_13150 [Aurantiacibacter xanthus]